MLPGGTASGTCSASCPAGEFPAVTDGSCALCAAGYEASVDEQVEVAFTVSPRVRRIGAHDPHTLPFWEYYRQMFWSSGIDLNEETMPQLTEEVTLEAMELPAGEKAVLSLQLPQQFIIVFEPVTHAAHPHANATRRGAARAGFVATAERPHHARAADAVAVGVDEEVARVRIAVEEAVGEHLRAPRLLGDE